MTSPVPTTSRSPVAESELCAGAAWVERFLRPLLEKHMDRLGRSRLTCLQIQPDDEDEAERLRYLGHDCTVGLWRPGEYGNRKWVRTPATVDPYRLPFPEGQFDLVFTGALGRIAPAGSARSALGRELARVCTAGGLVLAGVGNRYCPVDLSTPHDRLHSPFHPEKFSFGELRDMLVAEEAFASIHPLSLERHFGFGKMPRHLLFFAGAVAAWLRWSSNPEVLNRYAGPLNPVLMIVAEKSGIKDCVKM